MLCNNAMLNSVFSMTKCQIFLLNMTKYAKKMRNVDDDDYKVTTRTARAKLAVKKRPATPELLE